MSLVVQASNGNTAEVGLTGREGVVGGSVLLFPDAVALQPTIVHVPGSAWRISTDAFLAADDFPLLRGRRLRHVSSMHAQAVQSAACNALHAVEARFARWLLMTLDRLDADAVPLTPEHVALMLGVRRASVTAAAGGLQASGAVRYSRGRITIVDRSELEAVACECYRIHRDDMERTVRSHAN